MKDNHFKEVEIIKKRGVIVFCVMLALIMIISPINANDDLENQTANATDNLIIITEDTIQDYFDENNTLNSTFENKTIMLDGEFDSLGVLTIDAKNVTITGNEKTILTNTVFSVNKEQVTLTNISMNISYAFEENEYSGIFINADDVTISNINIYYVTPCDESAFGINSNSKKNTKIMNNTIYFEAHNNYDGTSYAIKLDKSFNATIENNNIQSSFPLRTINFETGGVNHVAGICIEFSDNFRLTNNNITVDVNKRPLSAYPTLVAVRIYGSNNGIVKNNDLSMEDFVTNLGSANYLYGIDVNDLRNLSVDSNNITIMTIGGVMAAGTAYGIQLTGPLNEINITRNDIYSISNGPNLGIYSQNYFGDTSINIEDNDINITGLAGKHEWALVAGIEVQDSNDRIVNNRIEVHSIAAVDEEDNLFGISYRQNIEGEHTFDIENNLVFSEGFYSVYLLSSTDSVIKNNLLVTSRENAPDKTLEGYKEGPKEHVGDTFFNNTVLNEYTYWSKLLNTIDGGENTTYVTPENVNNRTNTVNGKIVGPNNDNPNYNTNPNRPGNGTRPERPNLNPHEETPSGQGSEDGEGMNDYTNSTTNGGLDDYTNSTSKAKMDDYTNKSRDKKSETDDYTNSTKSNSENELVDYTNSKTDSETKLDDYTNKTKTDSETELDDYTKSNTSSEDVDLTEEEINENWEDYTNHDRNNDNDWQDYTKTQKSSQEQNSEGTYIDDSEDPLNNGVSTPDSRVHSNMTSNTEGGKVNTDMNNGELIKTNSTTPSDTGDESVKSMEKTSRSSNSESSGPSQASAVSPSDAYEAPSQNAYEITKSVTDHPQETNIIIPIVLGLIVLALLVIGYRRKSDDEDY